MITHAAPEATTIDDPGLALQGPEPIAVRIRGLTKHFGSGEQRVTALRGVDWDVDYGQMFGGAVFTALLPMAVLLVFQRYFIASFATTGSKD